MKNWSLTALMALLASTMILSSGSVSQIDQYPWQRDVSGNIYKLDIGSLNAGESFHINVKSMAVFPWGVKVYRYYPEQGIFDEVKSWWGWHMVDFKDISADMTGIGHYYLLTTTDTGISLCLQPFGIGFCPSSSMMPSTSWTVYVNKIGTPDETCPKLEDIIGLINGWQAGTVELGTVIDAINRWSSSACTDSSGKSPVIVEQQKAQLMEMLQNPSNQGPQNQEPTNQGPYSQGPLNQEPYNNQEPYGQGGFPN
ncbi:MAG: hypothetical protein WAW52_11880 [Methanothrix sp.]